jgi:hypothetical protein
MEKVYETADDFHHGRPSTKRDLLLHYLPATFGTPLAIMHYRETVCVRREDSSRVEVLT